MHRFVELRGHVFDGFAEDKTRYERELAVLPDEARTAAEQRVAAQALQKLSSAWVRPSRSINLPGMSAFWHPCTPACHSIVQGGVVSEVSHSLWSPLRSGGQAARQEGRRQRGGWRPCARSGEAAQTL